MRSLCMSTQTKPSVFGDPEALIQVIGAVLAIVAVLLVVLVVALSVPAPAFLSVSGLAVAAVVFWGALVALLYAMYRLR